MKLIHNWNNLESLETAFKMLIIPMMNKNILSTHFVRFKFPFHFMEDNFLNQFDFNIKLFTLTFFCYHTCDKLDLCFHVRVKLKNQTSSSKRLMQPKKLKFNFRFDFETIKYFQFDLIFLQLSFYSFKTKLPRGY